MNLPKLIIPSHESMIPLPIPEPLAGFFFHLEAYCVYYCCGMDAFNFEEENVSAWIQDQGGDIAKIALRQLRDIQSSTKTKMPGQSFALMVNEQDCAAFLEKAEICLASGIELCEGEGFNANSR